MRRTKVGFIPIQVIAELIDLPEGWRLANIAASWDPPGCQIQIEAPGFDEVPDNAESPRIRLASEAQLVEVPIVGRRGTESKVFRRIEVEPQ